MGIFDFFKNKPAIPALKVQYDFSAVDSNEKAKALYEDKQLAKLFLMPLDCGGEDNALNTLYVTPAANREKEEFDAKVVAFLEQGLQLGYNASPEYKGNSFIPSKITVKVTGDKQMIKTIEVW
jgi:hypothetical protein